MVFTNVCEEYQGPFSSNIDKYSERISTRSSRYKASQAKIIEMHNGVGKKASDSNFMCYNRIGSKEAIANKKIASLKRSTLSVVQYTVARYLKSVVMRCSAKVFFEPCASADQLDLAHMRPWPNRPWDQFRWTRREGNWAS